MGYGETTCPRCGNYTCVEHEPSFCVGVLGAKAKDHQTERRFLKQMLIALVKEIPDIMKDPRMATIAASLADVEV